jgi:hypothetical protein
MTEEDRFDFKAETSEPLAPLDNGLPGFRLDGLKDVSGTFAGELDDGVAALLGETTDIHTLYLYGPDPNIRWWRHWFYRIREAVRGTPYPTIILASGPATMQFEEKHEDEQDVIFSGTFTKAGDWYFHDKEVNR